MNDDEIKRLKDFAAEMLRAAQEAEEQKILDDVVAEREKFESKDSTRLLDLEESVKYLAAEVTNLRAQVAALQAKNRPYDPWRRTYPYDYYFYYTSSTSNNTKGHDPKK